MKKKFYFLMIALWSAITLTAQTPQTFTYQAVVRDNHGLVCNRTVGVQLTILQGSEEGTAVYTDRQTVRTNANGLFTVLIGNEGNSIAGIDWGQGPYFLKSEVDPAGGTQYSLTTVQQMFSVPYALRAHVVDSIIGGVQYTETDPVFSAWSKDYNDLTNKPVIPTVPANVSAFTNDAGYLTSYTETDPVFSAWTKDYNDLTNKPHLFSGDYDSLSNLPHLFPWDYDSLLNKPTTIEWDSVTGKPQLFSGDYNDLANKPHLFSGDYDSLINKPTTIDWDSITNQPIIPRVPVDVSEFNNDAGYLTAEVQVLSISNDTLYLSGDTNSFVKLPTTIAWDSVTNKPTTIEWDSVTNKPTTIEWDSVTNKPSNVSAFNNDAGYITAADLTAIYDQLTHLAAIIDSLGDTLAARTHRYDSVIAYQQHLIDSMHCLIPFYGDTTATACGSFTWHDSVYTETPTIAPTFTYISAAGCDSIVTLHLTVSYANTGDTTVCAVDSYVWNGITYTETPSIEPTDTVTNAAGCDSVVTLYLNIIHPVPSFDANGATLSTFSVSDTSQVKFSRGNLQYNAALGTHATATGTAAGTWRFAEHQYDFVDTDNDSVSSTYDGWIDLFGPGTSGWNSGAAAYQPWDTVATGYIVGSLTGDSAYADWSTYNAISNGGNLPGMWRVMTFDEIYYLFITRNASPLGDSANARFAVAKVGDVMGCLVFPDVYTHPAGLAVPMSINDTAPEVFTSYTLCEWAEMEAGGCVFLPMNGLRDDGVTVGPNSFAFYYSSSYEINVTDGAEGLMGLFLRLDLASPLYYNGDNFGSSVRPVMVIEE